MRAIAQSKSGFTSGIGQALDASDSVLNRFRLAASQPTGLEFDAAQRRLFVAVRHAVLVLNAETGAVEALLEGGSLTAIRTGAGCGRRVGRGPDPE